MKRRRRVLSSLFVTTVLVFTAIVVWHWQTQVRAALPAHTALYTQSELPDEDHEQAPFIPRPNETRAATVAERRAATATIVAQLNAFNLGDYAKAMTYQGAALHPKFRTPDAFRVTIQHHFPEFADYKKVVFGPARADKQGVVLMQPLMLTGRDGVTVAAIYMMVLENNIYYVEGVQDVVPVRPHLHGVGVS